MPQNNSQLVLERDCTNICQSLIHGGKINAAITKRTVTDKQLASYINSLCCNYSQVKDEAGRTALHMAASCGRLKLCHWLIKYGNADLSLRDKENLATALHRSLFYGQITVAVFLIKAGANVSITDCDDLTASNIVMKILTPCMNYSFSSCCQVYIWGMNSNYTHGSGNQQARLQPELVDTFRRNNICINKICMDKFHSVFVSAEGRAWSCGHGLGGRLGLDSEGTFLTPQPIRVGSELVKTASIGRDHTVLLMECGSIWTCGMNTHHQLGHVPPPEKLLLPRPISLRNVKPSDIVGIAAARFHTVFWTRKSVFTFGLHAGQLGHPASTETTIPGPRLVTSLNHNLTITHVAASDGATVVAVKKGDIYVLHEYQTRKIASRLLNISKIAVIGGNLNERTDAKSLMEQGGGELQIVVLTSVGEILLWQESSPQSTRCAFNLHRSIEVTDVAISRSHMLFVTKDGEGFQGKVIAKSRKKPTGTVPKSPSGIDRDDYRFVKIQRLAHLHRAVAITSDPKGRNFAAIQAHPKSSLVELPQVGPSEMFQDLCSLLLEASEDDTLHDIVFEVGYERFPAHRYILSLSSELGEEQLTGEEGCVPVVKLENMNPVIFHQLLQFIYTGDCDIIHPGPCEIKPVSSKKEDPVRMLLEAAKKYKVTSLIKILQTLRYDSTMILLKDGFNSINEPTPPSPDRNSRKDLYDVQIVTSDGGCIKAHKCVLVARLDYFQSMLGGGWIEASATSSLKLPISTAVMTDVINFIYNDSEKSLSAPDDFEHVCSVLIVADELFITRLKEICEVALSVCLNLRNAACLLQFSDTYNALQLKNCCMAFISLNLPAILEIRTLENVDVEVLKCLSTYYKSMLPLMAQHIITPYSNAPEDEEVIAAEMFSVPWDEEGDLELELDSLGNRITPIKQGRSSSSATSLTPSAKKKQRARKSSTNTSEAQRRRYELASSNSDLELATSPKSYDESLKCIEEWITVSDKSQKNVLTRLKAALKASEIQPSPEDFVQLSAKSAPSPIVTTNNHNISPSSPSLSDASHFPQLSNNQTYAKSPPSRSSTIEIKRTQPIKLSQKQRKKLAAGSPTESNTVVAQTHSPSAWGNIAQSKSDLSFKEILEEARLDNGSPLSHSILRVSESNSPKLGKSYPCLSDIVADELKQKENWSRMRTKPFHLTQIEEQAIESLLAFYNAANVFDERITVQRVARGNIAKPTWITSKR